MIKDAIGSAAPKTPKEQILDSVSFNPSRGEQIDRHLSRLERLKQALLDEKQQKYPSQDRVTSLQTEIERRKAELDLLLPGYTEK